MFQSHRLYFKCNPIFSGSKSRWWYHEAWFTCWRRAHIWVAGKFVSQCRFYYSIIVYYWRIALFQADSEIVAKRWLAWFFILLEDRKKRPTSDSMSVCYKPFKSNQMLSLKLLCNHVFWSFILHLLLEWKVLETWSTK